MAEPVVENATLQILLTATEELQSIPGAEGETITNDRFNIGPSSFNPDTSVPVSRASYQEYTISSGTADIDLTDLASTQSDIDGTGKKVQAIKFTNTGDASMTIGPGTSNKYHLFGTDITVTVPAGCTLVMYFADQLADISSTVKALRITGTNGEVAQVAFWLG